MFTYILYALLAWFLYNLVFKFIIPIYRASRQVKQQFRQMQDQFQQAARQQQGQQSTGGQTVVDANPPAKKTAPQSSDDYLEFEEVK